MLQFANDRIRIRSIIRKLAKTIPTFASRGTRPVRPARPGGLCRASLVSIFLVGVILLGIVTAANSPRCFQGRLVLAVFVSFVLRVAPVPDETDTIWSWSPSISSRRWRPCGACRWPRAVAPASLWVWKYDESGGASQRQARLAISLSARAMRMHEPRRKLQLPP
jgi:hypothetical protein